MKIEKELIIGNKLGLHARPAANFVQVANKFTSDITVIKNEIRANGKSIMEILTLEANQGSKIKIVVFGEDAKEAVDELEKILIKENS